jgi:LPPG:FO 2-phospho-L-lactate transferase
MTAPRVVALSGGVGGAKLSLGLYRSLPADALTVVVNTGDDFSHLGLRISPDIDTTLYTLAGLVNPETGWGRRDETWTFMNTLATLGGETWFRLGDGDLALHVERTGRLARGESLSEVTAELAMRFGIRATVLPMSDDLVATRVATPSGELGFQEYFVHLQCQPRVTALRFDGASVARPAPGIATALAGKDLAAVIICPSNPYLSIDPVLAVPGIRSLLRAAGAPVIAVSPLIGGRAVKGPTAKIMTELSLPVSPLEVVRHYRGLIDGFVLDRRDEHLAGQFDLPVCVTDTLMVSLDDRLRLANDVLRFASSLTRREALAS